MTEATRLLELAERVEAAEGPDRLLDANIHWQVRREDFEADEEHTDATYCYARGGWTLNRADRYFLDTVPVPAYTASLDAAMTLANSDRWSLLSADGEDTACATVLTSEDAYHSDAATPALALTSACLRARAAQGEG